MKKCIFAIAMIALLLCLSTSAVNATTRTINSAGGADFTTIGAALTASTAGDILNIIGGGPYDEVITITQPITLQGFNYRPVLAVKLNPGAVGTNCGLVINANGEVTCQNLTVIPSITSIPTNIGFTMNGTSAPNMHVVLNNILVCPNNGSNAPVSTDGLTLVDLTGATNFTTTVMNVQSGARADLTNVIITNNRPGAVRIDGFTKNSSAGMVTIGPGVLVSYNNGIGLQLNSQCTVAGSLASPVKVIANDQINDPGTNAGIVMFDLGTPSIGTSLFKNIIVAGNGGPGFKTGVPSTGTGSNCFISSISNALIANNSTQGLWIAGEVGTLSLVSVTLANNSTAPIQIDATSSLTTNGLNVIISGNGNQADAANVIVNNGTGLLSLATSAIVETGSYSLTTTGGGVSGTGITTQSSLVSADPAYLSVNPFNGSYLNVGNTFYWNKGPSGGALTGGAVFSPTFSLTPTAPVSVINGQNVVFTAINSVGPYSNWSTTNPAVGTISSFANSTANFHSVSIGSTFIVVTDGNGFTLTFGPVLVTPTSTPVFNETEVPATTRKSIELAYQ